MNIPDDAIPMSIQNKIKKCCSYEDIGHYLYYYHYYIINQLNKGSEAVV